MAVAALHGLQSLAPEMEQKGDDLRHRYRYGKATKAELRAYFRERGNLLKMVNDQRMRVALLEGPGYVPATDEA